MPEELYALPEIYDIAFSWDVTKEIGFFGRVFEEHVPFTVEHILEPACGSGRFLVTLPKHGYHVTGYDVSPGMLAYAAKRVEEAGVAEMVETRVADMVTARFDREFDAALNSINSLGYLREDDEIVSHLRNTGLSLKPGGVYIVHIACAGETGRDGPSGGTWEMERDGIRVRTTWDVEREDYETKRSHQINTMEIDDHGDKQVLVDRHVLRLWIYDELKELVRACGTLEYAAVYSESLERLPHETHKTRQLGNIYHHQRYRR